MEQNELDIVLALLKNRELHVRALSKMLSIPHSTISRAMKRLLNKNVVDFRFEGKNKVFRLKKSIETMNYAYMAEHFKLLKLFEAYPFTSVLIESIKAKVNERLIIIFGSFAKFTANKDSDIDIFIETADRKVKDEIKSINSRLSIKLGKFDKDSLLVKEIIKDHIIVKGVEYYYEKNKIFD